MLLFARRIYDTLSNENKLGSMALWRMRQPKQALLVVVRDICLSIQTRGGDFNPWVDFCYLYTQMGQIN